MALNMVLKGMLDNFKKEYLLDGMEETKAFEYFVNYLIISKYHPDAFADIGDLEQVDVDKKSQFGLDAIAFIVNGNLVLSKDDIPIYTKSKKLVVDIIFIQTKTSESCDTGDLLKAIHGAKRFLTNFDNVNEKNANIINAREIYDELFDYKNYRYFTSQSPMCHIYYVTAAGGWDNNIVGGICAESERDIKSTVADIKGVDVHVIGREYITDAYREVNNNVSVNISLKNCVTLDRIEGVNEAYVGYLTGSDYLNIICDNHGELRRYIFYDNVRDYQGFQNSVNTEIRNTISSEKTRGQFVLLNNGVTIITKSVTSLGSGMFEISNFQIVNGCQTSNEIYNCKEVATEVFVPVKIIYTVDNEIISSIVKATNRQSPVSEEAFLALGKYHKDLQTLFSQYSKEMPLEMFYERRSGELDDIKVKKGRYQVVTLHGITRAFESVYCQNPNMVYGTNPANILRSEKEKIFSAEHKMETYYIASYMFVKFVNMQQEGSLSKDDYGLRFYVIMIARILMIRHFKVPNLSSTEMDKENREILTMLKSNNVDGYFIKAKEIVRKLYNDEYSNKKRYDVLRSADFCRRVKDYVVQCISVQGY